jgi:tetratricopeptide (TPR) repeat protein
MRDVPKTWLTIGVPVTLLLILLFELVSSISLQSVTWDEGDHLFAGYMSVKARDHSLNPEHPPLAKMVAALPLLPMHLKVIPPLGRYFKDEAYLRGRELIFRNGPANGGSYSADTIMFRARMAVSVFTFALALMVLFAGSEMFSLPAGLLAMALFVFEPSIIANGAYVTTDETVACMFFAAIFTFYRYVKQPTAARLVVAGVAAGLTLAAKHSGVLLLPMLLVLAAGELVLQRRSVSRKMTLPRMAAAIVVISAIAIFVLWSFYYFRFNMRPDGSAMVPSLAANAAALKPWQDKGILFFARFHLLPESYLYGLVDVMAVADLTPSFLLGKVYSHGVWFYFPIVIALKWTIGAAALLLIAIYAAASGRLRRPREVLFLTVPPIVYLAVAIASPLNIGVRHILPIFPFLLVLAAGGAWALVQRNRRWGYAVAVLLVFHVVSSARAFPNYLPYANELWGGPSETNRYLSDSATDWAQQLKATKLYIDQHHIEHCWFAYFAEPFLQPADYGIPCKLLPTADTMGQLVLPVPTTIDGPVLISYGDINGFEFGTSLRNPYQAFFTRKPDAVIADGIAVFNGSYSVPLASALEHVKKSNDALAKDPQLALREADLAVATAPNDFDPILAKADALRATGNKGEALTFYEKALAIADRMEASARADWIETLTRRMQSVSDLKLR